MTAPLRKTYCFSSPRGISKEVSDLMESTPLQTCIPAGSSDLGQSAFKIMRSTNLMKMQRINGAFKTEKAYEKLRDEMLGRKKAFEESVTDYKMSLIRAKEQKKKI